MSTEVVAVSWCSAFFFFAALRSAGMGEGGGGKVNVRGWRGVVNNGHTYVSVSFLICVFWRIVNPRDASCLAGRKSDA